MSRRPLIAHRYPTAIVWWRTRETFNLELRQKAPQSLWCINTDWRFPPHDITRRVYAAPKWGWRVEHVHPGWHFPFARVNSSRLALFHKMSTLPWPAVSSWMGRRRGGWANKQTKKKTVYRDLRAPQRKEAEWCQIANVDWAVARFLSNRRPEQLKS